MTVAWYVHHHGSGHRQRALAVLRHVSAPAVVLSQLPRPAAAPSHVPWLTLPSDVPAARWSGDATAGGRLHWAPPRQPTMRRWASALLGALERHDVTALVSDVSVEATVLARTAGVPVIAMRQHGRRDDAAHTLGYDMASAALAPYPEWFEQPGTPRGLRAKTTYVGGLSRWEPRAPDRSRVGGGPVVVLLGAGGTAADHAHLDRLAASCARPWIGLGRAPRAASPIDWRGHLPDPSRVLGAAAVVVSAAGHNSVMECAALRRPLVCVPEPRPFGEQVARATLLSDLGLAVAVPEWTALRARHLRLAGALGGDRLADLVAADAARVAARRVEEVAAWHH